MATPICQMLHITKEICQFFGVTIPSPYACLFMVAVLIQGKVFALCLLCIFVGVAFIGDNTQP